jgi:hypothetical protein
MATNVGVPIVRLPDGPSKGGAEPGVEEEALETQPARVVGE